MSKVGIVIRDIYQNEHLQLTIDSIERANCDIPFSFYHSSEIFDNREITHICFLSSGIIVSDGWLDSLASDAFDILVPVSNQAMNEQKVAIDIDPVEDNTAFTIVGNFAGKRKNIYKGYVVESELVSLAAVVLKREVLEKVGLPDEMLSDTIFESSDYCLRIRRGGFRTWIARDTYVHSFIKYGETYLIEKKSFFEEKWNTQWKDPSIKALDSVLQDEKFLRQNDRNDSWAEEMIKIGLRDFKRQYESLLNTISDIKEENIYLEAKLQDEISFGENVNQIRRKIKRRLFSRKRNNNDDSSKIKIVASEVSKILEKTKLKTVAVFAPMFTSDNIGDGYIQRVKAIDEEVLNDCFKIYLQVQEPELSPDIRVIDDKHICLWLDPTNPRQAKELSRIIQQSEIVYIHSVLRLMKNTIPDKVRDEMFANSRNKIIWDVHGAVPEEFEAQSDFYKAQIAREAEKFIAEQSDIAIVVSNAMREHLEEKYSDRLKATIIVMPIFNAEFLMSVGSADEKELCLGEKPLVVYAGGLQKWQKIEEMQDIISSVGDRCRYAIFCPRPEEFIYKWGLRSRPSDMRVEHRSPEDIKIEYKECHYGFSLRDDITVNNVACPTKLIEYIQYGIIPVLETARIGDFEDMGMEYIGVKSFEAGEFSEEAERQRMVKKNYTILKKLTDMYLEGKQSVLRNL